MNETLVLRIDHWEEMRAHVDGCAPLEGCGLLAGNGRAVREVFPITNEAHSAVRFRMAPVEQLRAFDAIEQAGMQLLGIFHSHPANQVDRSSAGAAPSETDILEATYAVVHLIWSRRADEWSARGFWIENGRVTEVPLIVSSGQ
jgi:proteasome lid subunit RPN8/RPN11